MKKIMWMILCSLIMTCCTENEESADVQASKFTLPAAEYTWNSNVRQQSIHITSGSAWTVASNVSWCDPYKASGKGNYSLALWIDPNITSTERSGTLTFISNDTQHTIKITQPAYNSDTSYIYRIPIVFHVLYKDSLDTTQYVKKGWLAKVIRAVNYLYAYNKTNLQFEMANLDEDGDTLSEPGVIRHKVTFSNYDAEKFLEEQNQYANYELNLKRYLNVFIYRFSDDSQLGISNMAMVPSAYPLDGLRTNNSSSSITKSTAPFGCCINSEYIYENENNGYYNPYFILVTLAHELGHYVGLLHSFSENGCNDDDYCSDTRNCNYTLYKANLEIQHDSLIAKYGRNKVTLKQISTREGCDGEQYVADNIMDYAYCLSDTITAQQRARIKHVLNYGTVIPGPKLSSTTTRTAEDAITEPSIAICPTVPTFNVTRGTDENKFPLVK